MNPTPEKRAIADMCAIEWLKEVRVSVLVRDSFCTDRCTCDTEKELGSRGSKLSEKAWNRYGAIFAPISQSYETPDTAIILR